MTEPARIVALPSASQAEPSKSPAFQEDEFLRLGDLSTVTAEAARRAGAAARGELAELYRESRWLGFTPCKLTNRRKPLLAVALPRSAE
jgi:hypothetical protein